MNGLIAGQNTTAVSTTTHIAIFMGGFEIPERSFDGHCSARQTTKIGPNIRHIDGAKTEINPDTPPWKACRQPISQRSSPVFLWTAVLKYSPLRLPAVQCLSRRQCERSAHPRNRPEAHRVRSCSAKNVNALWQGEKVGSSARQRSEWTCNSSRTSRRMTTHNPPPSQPCPVGRRLQSRLAGSHVGMIHLRTLSAHAPTPGDLSNGVIGGPVTIVNQPSHTSSPPENSWLASSQSTGPAVQVK